ncbi:MAG: matrixin family metalloprotease, partial [Pseudomonadota bacterium]
MKLKILPLLIALLAFYAGNTYAYSTDGDNKRSETSVVIYYDKEGSAVWPAGTETAIANAMSTWNSCGMKFEFFNGGDCSGCSHEILKNKNFIFYTGESWEKEPAQASVTAIAHDGLTPTYIFIYLNSNLTWSTKSTPDGDEYDVQSVITHELGHAMGLLDSSSGRAMHGPCQAGTIVMRTLNQDDTNGAAFLYGTSSFNTTTTSVLKTTTTTVGGGGGGGGGG